MLASVDATSLAALVDRADVRARLRAENERLQANFVHSEKLVALGTLVAYNIDVIVPWIEHALGIQFLPQQIYFISELPSNPQLGDIAVIGGTSLVLSLLATLYPSWRAARLQPARVLRHD